MLCLLSAGEVDKIQMMKTKSHYVITFLEKTGAYKFALNLFPNRETPVIHDLYPLIDTFYLKLYDYYPIDGKIVDIGGYIGDTAIYFSRKGAKTIEVFEPNPYNYEYLLLNLKLNNCSNVKPFQLAVAKDNGCAILHMPRYVSGGSSLYTTSLTQGELRSSIKSQVRTISCHRVLSSHIDLLKMDCKGCEEAIILQCGEELQNNVDYLIYQSETLDKFHFGKLLDTLKELNFDIDKVDRTYRMVYASSRR
jgi:FkbM family methyltransferase